MAASVIARILAILLVWSWSGTVFSQGNFAQDILVREDLQAFDANGGEAGKSLTRSLYFWLDPESSHSRDDVLEAFQNGQFSNSRSSKPFAGMRAVQSTLWLLVLIDNKANSPLSVVLEHPAASFYIHMHQYRTDQQQWNFFRNGFLALNPQYANDYRYPVFQVELDPGRNLFLLEVHAVEKEAMLSLWNPTTFDRHRSKDMMIVNFAFGGLLVIMFYNFCTFLITRSPDYLIYSAYLLCFLAIQFFLQGTGAQVFGPYANALLIAPLQFWVGCTIIFMQIFVVKFLSLSLYMPAIKRTFQVLNALILLACFYSLHNVVTGSLFLMFFAAPSILLTFYASWVRMRSGFRPALYFLQSFGVLGIGVLIFLLGRVDIFGATTLFSRSAIMIGGLAESILLSIAIGNKISLALQEQNKRILEEQSKRMHAFKQMEKVFFPHQMKQIEGGDALENTMPTQWSEACVICFDIIGSTRIKHERTKEFFRNLFRRCNEAMMENYDESILRADAYRIKEMGDGFLCSVGYPFRSRSGQIAEDALEMAKKFQRILEEESRILDPEQAICCGIGIAFDEIVGFYPESGTREYDLFGRAIVLATRYESARKTILRDGDHGNIIILQERVYNSLSRESRQGFVKAELNQGRFPGGLSVRDDAGASCLYYQVENPDNKPTALPSVS